MGYLGQTVLFIVGYMLIIVVLKGMLDVPDGPTLSALMLFTGLRVIDAIYSAAGKEGGKE